MSSSKTNKRDLNLVQFSLSTSPSLSPVLMLLPCTLTHVCVEPPVGVWGTEGTCREVNL